MRALLCSWALSFSLFFLFLVESGRGDDVLVCNSVSSLSAAFISGSVYARNPADVSIDCTDEFMSSEDQVYSSQRILCDFTVLLDWGCFQRLDDAHSAYVSRCTQERLQAADAAAGLNARIPAADAPFASLDLGSVASTPTQMYVDFVLDVDAPRSSVYSPDGALMYWTSLAFVGGFVSSTESVPGKLQTSPQDWVWLPPAQLAAATRVTLNTKTLLLDGQSMLPDLALDPAVPDKSLVRTTRAGSRDSAWAVRTKGCGALQMVLRVQWLQTTEYRRGQSVAGGGSVACWQRVLTVMRFNTVPMACALPYPLNVLRGMLPQGRELVRRQLTQAAWAVSTTTSTQTTTMRYSAAQADLLLECAQPSGGSGVGGTWRFWSDSTPGLCVPCSDWDAATLQNNKMRVRACNRSVAGEGDGVDCCTECRAGYMLPPGATQCVLWCRPGTYYTSGGCWPCAAGTFSLGGLAPCLTCVQLGFWNAYADRLRGCVTCDPRTVVTSSSSGGYACLPCPPGMRVPPRSSVCQPCTPAAYYLPAAGTACLACPAGTYMDAIASTTSCQTCAPNYVTQAPASTVCTACAVGTRHNTNHSQCVACPPLNATLLPFAVYASAGCGATCRAGVSYARTSPLVPGGCANCSALAVPSGRYASGVVGDYVSAWVTCPATLPCTNAPAKATYTGPSPIRGASQCPFVCNAGYSGAACAPCAAAGFNASVHRYVASSSSAGGCDFTCKPYVYVDALRACRSPCVNLLAEYTQTGRLAARVRDYYDLQVASRAYYVFGACGTSEVDAGAVMPLVLRRALWAYLMHPSVGGVCGDSILNAGETCDDGNARGGDGCGATCQVEGEGGWDCDLIGAPCLLQCGWPSVAAQAGDVGLATWGFVLPPLPPASATRQPCDGLRYADIRDTVTDRLGWMRAHLVSCDCDGRPYRALPYANCTAANRGCRICGAGFFHDDVRSVCVACGTTCAPGFSPAASFASCGGGGGNTTSSSSLSDQQLAMGCVACPPPSVGSGSVTYIASPCRYACRRSSGSTQDAYCRTAPDSATGICSSFCVLCSQGLSALLTTPAPSSAGWYPQGCTDGVGYVWAPCDAAALPANAVWTTNAVASNDARGCGFTCSATAKAWNGACYACSAAATCTPGQHLTPCQQQQQQQQQTWACVPCEGALPGALQAWTSLPPFLACVADCEPGVGYAAQMGSPCFPCTRLTCGLGELYRACVPRADAGCDRCPPLPDHSEYAVAGACDTRCAAGFFWAATACQPCASVVCGQGFAPSHQCLSPAERLKAPACVRCEGALLPSAAWGTACAQVCARQRIVLNGACVVCDPLLCGLNQSGTCASSSLLSFSTSSSSLSIITSQLYATTQLTCAPCPDPPPLGTRFAQAGLCTAVTCLPGLVPSLEHDGCSPPSQASSSPPPPPPSSSSSLVLAAGSSALPALEYPVRGRRHS